MGKFNKTASVKTAVMNHPQRTTNHEGGMAFNVDDETRLYMRAASCMMNEPKFYKESDENGITTQNQDELLLTDLKAVAKSNPEFILQLAAYARNSLFLRSVPVVMLVEASLIDECKPFVRKYAPHIIKRADELTEAVAYLQAKVGHIGSKRSKGSMPASLKKGLADCFHNFNTYQFAKYDREGTVKLRDVIRLVHPTPKTAEEKKLFEQVAKRTLPIPETWETVISTKGSTKEAWLSVIPKMGYMALLRNLKNFLAKDIDTKGICIRIADKSQVLKSKQLPFRFYSAYRIIEESGLPQSKFVLDALEDAMDKSVENVPTLSGKTLVMVDLSGSMNDKLSEKSEVTRKQVASVLGAIVSKVCDEADIVAFGDTWKLLPIGKRNGILSITKTILNTDVGGSTEAAEALAGATRSAIYDRIILLSDMQCYTNRSYCNDVAVVFKKYKATKAKNVKLYSIDLAGYGTVQVPKDEPNTLLLAGFSERIFQFIKIFESDKKEALELIKSFSWRNNDGKEISDE